MVVKHLHRRNLRPKRWKANCIRIKCSKIGDIHTKQKDYSRFTRVRVWLSLSWLSGFWSRWWHTSVCTARDILVENPWLIHSEDTMPFVCPTSADIWYMKDHMDREHLGRADMTAWTLIYCSSNLIKPQQRPHTNPLECGNILLGRHQKNDWE